MAKDSNKLRVLARRKQELDHAIAHDCSPAAVQLRAEKLRAAAVAVLKKYRGAFAHVEGAPGHSSWEALQSHWEGLSVDEIIDLSARWGREPTLRDVRFGDAG